jgi:predicted Ser/Thr protein kinase
MDSSHSPGVVAGYRVDGTLGEGGMGTVYRATQLSLERVVALKVLTAELSSDPAFRERFRREGLLQAALDHPHIVTVYEAGEADGRLFLAMRMVEGPTLKELILRRELDDRRALRLLTQVAEALDAAHAKGLIHRDVKPQNVLVGAGDHAYLADFGLTKGSDDAGMTETGQFVGTIDYISPEQARGEQASARSDVYALTAVLCECLTGQVPYVRATEERALLAHLSEPPPRLSQVRADLPAALDEVVAEGMAKAPGDRPASAGELMLKARRAFGAVSATPTETTRVRPAAGTATRAPGTAAKGDPGATRLAAAASTPAEVGGASVVGQATAARGGDVGAGGEGPSASQAEGRTSTGAGLGRFVPAALAAAVLAGAVGFLLGGGSGGGGEAFTHSASSGHVELSFPSGWRQLPGVPAIPGLAFSQPLALAAGASNSGAGGGGERLLAGEVSASGPSLLPAAFSAALNGAPPRPEPVRLGAVEAYRYGGLSVRGLAGPLTLYVVPTSAGVAAAACLGPSSSPAGVQCAQIAAALKVNGATVFGLAPSPSYAAALAHIFGALRGAAAGRLAAAYGAAGRAIGGLSASPAVRSIDAGIAGSLAAVGRDYAALDTAAGTGNEAAYALAQHALAGDRARVAAAVAALRGAGYVVSG